MSAELVPLSDDEFPSFVAAVHDGASPFPWQRHLAKNVLTDDWPDVIRVPTGLGKTLVADVAVFALAREAAVDPAERRARTRTFIVIDRRVVVDQVSEHGSRLACRLEEALRSEPRGVVGRVARRLLDIGGGPPPNAHGVPQRQRPLEVIRMRGGATWAARWLERPDQPALIASTVDQLGSRLLFRGYGVSASSRAIDAALVGSDALIVLDEAHLARPLERTLEQLQAWEQAVPHPVLRRRAPRFVRMSATIRSVGPDNTVLDVSTADLQDEEAGRRLRATKHAILWNLNTKGARPEARKTLVHALARAAERAGEATGVDAIGVVANTVSTARSVHDELLARGHEVELVIGPSRDVDRSLVVHRVTEGAGTKTARDAPSGAAGHPLFVVATQTIEVGINLDFDALVSEAAPLDALAQRLGRLDRLGRRTEAGRVTRAVIVHARSLHEDDPIYGEALAKTWQWLEERGGSTDVKGKRGPDMAPLDGDLYLGPWALRSLVDAGGTDDLMAPTPRAPYVFAEEYLATWNQTSPVPRADPDIAPFLRGQERNPATVSFLWRADVSSSSPREVARAAERSIALRFPTGAEQVEIPLWHARRWLATTAADEEVPLTDTEIASFDAAGESLEEHASAKTVLGARVQEDRSCQAVESSSLRPGDVVILPADAGGLDGFGWNPRARGTPAVDVADLTETRRGLAVRLQPATLKPISPTAADVVAAWLAQHDEAILTAGRHLRLASSEINELLDRMIAAIEGDQVENEHLPYGGILSSVLKSIRNGHGPRRLTLVRHELDEAESPPVVLRAGPFAKADERSAFTGEYRSDADDSASLGEGRVPLERHTVCVRSLSRAYAKRLGLDPALVEAIALAAEWHDAGKVDQRFQRMLYGGDELAFVEGDPLLAKSGMDPSDRAGFRRARENAGWPAGLRHEALSIALLDGWADQGGTSKFPNESLDLVRHLIASHHGFARPLFDPVPGIELIDLELCCNGTTVSVPADRLGPYVVDWSQPARMRRLMQRHGAWGLALLEAILRLADMTCSARGT